MCASMAWSMLRTHVQAVHASTPAVGQDGAMMLGLAAFMAPYQVRGFPVHWVHTGVCLACACGVLGLQLSPTLQAQQH